MANQFILQPDTVGKISLTYNFCTCNVILDFVSGQVEDMVRWNPMQEDFESERNNYRIDVDDPCVAVCGYKPKDDERICKFYKKSGHCWKKSCKMEHIRVGPGIFTTDTEEVYQNAFNKFQLPPNGASLLVKVTIVTSPCNFYAQIKEQGGNINIEEPETLESVLKYMNERKNVESFVPLESAPSIGQIVIALARFSTDSRQFWMRARADCVNDDSTCEVFYVDFGTQETIALKNIYEMQPRFLHLPFQAIECSLANVELVDSKSVTESCGLLRDLIDEKVLHGKVFERSQELQKLDLLLRDEKGVDIGKTLAETGLYRLIKKPPKVTQVDKYIPG